MPDIWMDVDTAVAAPMSLMPIVEDDGLTIEEALVYDFAGIAVQWNFSTCAGVTTCVAITPTTADDHDISEPLANVGMYTIDIPASGGDANNDTEGVGWITGIATGLMAWRGPTIGFRAAAINNALIDDATITVGTCTTNTDMVTEPPTAAAVVNEFETQSQADPTGFHVNVLEVNGTAQTANDNGADINEILTDTGTTIPGTITTAQNDLDIITGTDGVTLATAQALYAPNKVVPDVAGTAPTAAEVVNEFETQSQADPTGFHVNVLEVNGTAQTANDNGADINAILTDTDELQADDIPGTLATIAGYLDTEIADLPTTAEFEARTLVAADYTVVGDLGTVQSADNNTILAHADYGNAKLARTGADSDTLETLSDEIAAAQTDLDTLTDARGEPAQGAPPASATTNLKIDHIYKRIRNKQDSDGTTEKYYNDDASTVDSKRTVSAAGGTVTKNEIVTGP